MARIQERDLIIPALQMAAASPLGEITTSDLIEGLTERFQPEGRDAEKIEGRQDSHFSQKVRNLISHRETDGSMFSKGYATYHRESESIRITEEGRTFLNQVPGE